MRALRLLPLISFLLLPLSSAADPILKSSENSDGQPVTDSFGTQGDYVVDLVRGLGLERLLPLAATQADYVQVLRDQAILPLKDWDVERPLDRDVFGEVVLRIQGKEDILFRAAQDRCDLAADWIEYAQRQTSASSSSEAIPTCPFGAPFQDRNHDGRIDRHHHLKGILAWSRW